jgi:hypothetical protein
MPAKKIATAKTEIKEAAAAVVEVKKSLIQTVMDVVNSPMDVRRWQALIAVLGILYGIIF